MAEVRVVYVFDEADGFSGGFHFGSEFFVDVGEFVEREDGFFDGVSFHAGFYFEVGELVCSEHYFGGDVDVGDFVCLGDEGDGARGAGVGFDDIDLFVFDYELDVEQAADIEGAGDLV